jgi:hypothetical protein
MGSTSLTDVFAIQYSPTLHGAEEAIHDDMAVHLDGMAAFRDHFRHHLVAWVFISVLKFPAAEVLYDVSTGKFDVDIFEHLLACRVAFLKTCLSAGVIAALFESSACFKAFNI